VRPIRAGIIGVGVLGAEHARLLSSSVAFELVGVHDTDGDRARTVAEAAGTRPADDLGELAERAEAMVVAVPTASHAEVATACLEADCHVLVEKPLTRTIAEADALVSRAHAAGRVLGVGHVERFNGILMACEPYLRSPRFIESHRLAPFQPRGTDVTVILDLMIHDIDLVLGLARAPLSDVRAIGASFMTDSIDLANARLTFEDGAVANITASRVSVKPLRQLRLFQDSGYFSLDLAAGVGEHLRRLDHAPFPVRGVEDLVERIGLTAVAGEPLARELDAFALSIRGEPSRLVTGARGRDALEVAARITHEIERPECR